MDLTQRQRKFPGKILNRVCLVARQNAVINTVG